MPVYKDEERGTWYARFRYTDWKGKRKETTKRGFKTKREAKEYENSLINQSSITPAITVSQLFKTYLSHNNNRRRSTTNALDCALFNNHIAPLLGDMNVADVKPNTIRKWQDSLTAYTSERTGDKLAPSTLHSINRVMTSLFNFAVKYYDLPGNPVAIVGGIGHADKRTECWSTDEFQTFIDVVPRRIDRVVFMLLFYTGMRIGELLALTLDDFDFTNKTVTINKTLTLCDGIHPPKTKAGTRTISLPIFIVAEIQRLLSSYSYKSDVVFPVKYSALSARYKKYVKKAGVPYYPIHTLRHSHASYLISKNIPITSIAYRLGHSSATMTLNIYAHMYGNGDRDIANLLENR